MRKSYEIEYHSFERDGWWFLGRRDMLVLLLKECPKESRILEIGCSSGVFLEQLRRAGFDNAHGIDISQVAIMKCISAGLHNVRVADGSASDFPNESFDVVIASDVLEHILDHHKALKEWCRILKPGGRLILFVPALHILWSRHDEENQHVRRYAKKELVNLLKEANFTIRRVGFWNFFAFVPVLASVFLEKVVAPGEGSIGRFNRVSRIINNIAYGFLKMENLYLNINLGFPFGVSLFAVAEKNNHRSSHIPQIKGARYE